MVQNLINCGFIWILALDYAVLKKPSLMVMMHGACLLILYDK